jgi:hypothetical protein
MKMKIRYDDNSYSIKHYTLKQAQALADKKARLDNARLHKPVFYGVVCNCTSIYEETGGIAGGSYWRISVAGQQEV